MSAEAVTATPQFVPLSVSSSPHGPTVGEKIGDATLAEFVSMLFEPVNETMVAPRLRAFVNAMCGADADSVERFHAALDKRMQAIPSDAVHVMVRLLCAEYNVNVCNAAVLRAAYGMMSEVFWNDLHMRGVFEDILKHDLQMNPMSIGAVIAFLGCKFEGEVDATGQWIHCSSMSVRHGVEALIHASDEMPVIMWDLCEVAVPFLTQAARMGLRYNRMWLRGSILMFHEQDEDDLGDTQVEQHVKLVKKMMFIDSTGLYGDDCSADRPDFGLTEPDEVTMRELAAFYHALPDGRVRSHFTRYTRGGVHFVDGRKSVISGDVHTRDLRGEMSLEDEVGCFTLGGWFMEQSTPAMRAELERCANTRDFFRYIVDNFARTTLEERVINGCQLARGHHDVHVPHAHLFEEQMQRRLLFLKYKHMSHHEFMQAQGAV